VPFSVYQTVSNLQSSSSSSQSIFTTAHVNSDKSNLPIASPAKTTSNEEASEAPKSAKTTSTVLNVAATTTSDCDDKVKFDRSKSLFVPGPGPGKVLHWHQKKAQLSDVFGYLKPQFINKSDGLYLEFSTSTDHEMAKGIVKTRNLDEIMTAIPKTNNAGQQEWKGEPKLQRQSQPRQPRPQVKPPGSLAECVDLVQSHYHDKRTGQRNGQMDSEERAYRMQMSEADKKRKDFSKPRSNSRSKEAGNDPFRFGGYNHILEHLDRNQSDVTSSSESTYLPRSQSACPPVQSKSDDSVDNASGQYPGSYRSDSGSDLDTSERRKTQNSMKKAASPEISDLTLKEIMEARSKGYSKFNSRPITPTARRPPVSPGRSTSTTKPSPIGSFSPSGPSTTYGGLISGAAREKEIGGSRFHDSFREPRPVRGSYKDRDNWEACKDTKDFTRDGPNREHSFSRGSSECEPERRRGCFLCGDEGHIRRNCPNTRKDPGLLSNHPGAYEGSNTNHGHFLPFPPKNPNQHMGVPNLLQDQLAQIACQLQQGWLTLNKERTEFNEERRLFEKKKQQLSVEWRKVAEEREMMLKRLFNSENDNKKSPNNPVKKSVVEPIMMCRDYRLLEDPTITCQVYKESGQDEDDDQLIDLTAVVDADQGILKPKVAVPKSMTDLQDLMDLGVSQRQPGAYGVHVEQDQAQGSVLLATDSPKADELEHEAVDDIVLDASEISSAAADNEDILEGELLWVESEAEEDRVDDEDFLGPDLLRLQAEVNEVMTAVDTAAEAGKILTATTEVVFGSAVICGADAAAAQKSAPSEEAFQLKSEAESEVSTQITALDSSMEDSGGQDSTTAPSVKSMATTLQQVLQLRGLNVDENNNVDGQDLMQMNAKVEANSTGDHDQQMVKAIHPVLEALKCRRESGESDITTPDSASAISTPSTDWGLD